MEHVTGRIIKLFAQKPSKWVAGKIRLVPGYDEIRFSGIASSQLGVGMTIEFDGEYLDHPVYGEQYECAKGSLITRVLVSRHDVLDFLSSDLFPGVGRGTAEKLYDLYGEDTIPQLKTEDGMKQAMKACNLRKNQVEVLSVGLHSQEGVVKLLRAFPHMRPAIAQRLVENHPKLDVNKLAQKVNSDFGYEYLHLQEHVSLMMTDEIMLYDVGVSLVARQRIEMMMYEALRNFMLDRNATYVRVSDNQDLNEFFNQFFLRVRMAEILPDDWDGMVFDAGCLMLHLQKWIAEGHTRLVTVTEPRLGADGQWEVCMYTVPMLEAEGQLSSAIADAWKEQQPVLTKRTADLTRWFKRCNQQGLLGNYTQEQKLAVGNAFQHSISFLSGGPGCGKTQTVKLLIQAWTALQGTSILLLAPTGKAVNRLKAQTGYNNAATVMRFLTMNGESRKTDCILDTFKMPFSVDLRTLIVVDESSMLGFVDASRLMSLVRGCTIVFVGDKDQLPAIEPGPFLQECLQSGKIFLTELTRNFRTQGSASAQVLNNNAKLILSGGKVKDMDLLHEAFQILPADEQKPVLASGELGVSQAEKFILEAYLDYLQQGADLSDVLVIAPFSSAKYPLSAANLNQLIRAHVNPETKVVPTVVRDDYGTFYDAKGFQTGIVDTDGLPILVGDRLMNLKNTMDLGWISFKNDNLFSMDDKLPETDNKGLFNGDAGRVVRVYMPTATRAATLIVALDDPRSEAERQANPQPTKYVCLVAEVDTQGKQHLKSWCLGYALSVHKAQGSEAEHVIVAMSEQGWQACARREMFGGMPFLTKNLLYTAVTRARSTVMLVGSLSAIQASMQTAYRFTNTHLAASVLAKI